MFSKPCQRILGAVVVMAGVFAAQKSLNSLQISFLAVSKVGKFICAPAIQT